MAVSSTDGKRIIPGTVTRGNMNTNGVVYGHAATTGLAVIVKAVNGTGITLSSTGYDAGTGDVTITANLSSGISGGQTAYGGTAASENLTLGSTVHATKGSILFGTSGYNEATNRLGIGVTNHVNTLHVREGGGGGATIRFDDGIGGSQGYWKFFIGGDEMDMGMFNVTTNVWVGGWNMNFGGEAEYFISGSGAMHRFYTSGSLGPSGMQNVLTISDTFRVGIGDFVSGAVTTPRALLDVMGGDALINTLNLGLGHNSIATNTVLGYQGLNANTTGAWNVSLGYQALKANTSGALNVAIGYIALAVNTTGTDNIATGYATLTTNTTGSYNVAMGSAALCFNTTANSNTGIGHNAGMHITTGSANVAIGYTALTSSTTADNNTAIGATAGYHLTTGHDNTFVGFNVGTGITTGSYNTIIGRYAGSLSATLHDNIIIATGQATKLQIDENNALIYNGAFGTAGQVLTSGGSGAATTWGAAGVNLTSAQTLTNKRIVNRVYSTTSVSTLTPEKDTYDVFHLTALANSLTIANHSTTTPNDNDSIEIKLLDSGAARALTFGTNYVAKGGTALPSTTVAGKNMTLGFKWNSNLSKYNLVALALEDAVSGGGSGTVTSVAISGSDFSISGSPVTTSGTIALEINPGVVTYTKIQNIPTASLVGRSAAGTGSMETLAISGAFTLASTTFSMVARNIYGNSYDGTAAVSGIIASTYGGTGNGFSKFTGATSTEKTYQLPNSNAIILTDQSLVTVAQGGTGTGTLTGIIKGNGTSAYTAVTAPAGTIVGTTDPQTLTSKWITPRVSSTTTLTTLTPEKASYDIYRLSAQASALTIANHSTTTQTDGDKMEITILDNSTARAITFGTDYVARAGIALPSTTVAGKQMVLGFEWFSSLTKYVLIAFGQET